MGRKKAIETEDLITFIDEFYITECNRNSSMLKIPAIGKYLREKKNLNVQDPVIRKNRQVREHIEKLKSSTEETHLKTVSIFRNIDIDEFLRINCTKEKLKKAITERDKYFREIADSAAYFFKENKKLESENSNLKKMVAELERNTKETEITNVDNISVKSKLEKENRLLRDIISTYVYPEIANELLKKDGLLKTTAEMVNSEVTEEKIITANDDISTIQNSVIRGLFERI